MTVRYAVSFFLIFLLLLLLGLVFGYLSLDTAAPEERQLTAAGALAYYLCDEWECWWEDDDWADDRAYLELPDDVEPPDVLDIGGEQFYLESEVIPYEEPWYWEPEESVYVIDEPILYDDPWFPGEWVEEYWIEEPVYVVQDPWYVQSFPGFGSFFQQIIPGQSRPAPRPTPAPPPRPVYPQPSCWISAQPSTVDYGKASTLSWSSFNSTRATLTDFGNVPLSGSRVVQNIRNERTYQLSVSGQGGSGSCYTRISVRAQSGNPTCMISAYPSSIHSGQSASLAWSSQNASSAYLSGVGAVAAQGGTYVAPRQTTTYTLTVYSGQGGSGACTAQVGVLP